MEYLLPRTYDMDSLVSSENPESIYKQIRADYGHIYIFINNIIKKYLPKLNMAEQKEISKNTFIILIFLFKKFNIPKKEFTNQIRLNNNRNIISIINLSLPYIDDKNDFYNHKNISSLTDIIENMNKSSSIDENKAKYCNYIYDHNIQKNLERKNYPTTTGDTIRMIDYEDKIYRFINSNELNYIYNYLLYFILDTIERTSYKLYINWINIFPIGLDYKEKEIYKNSFVYDDDIDSFVVNIEDDNIPLCWFRIYEHNNKILENDTVLDKKIYIENIKKRIEEFGITTFNADDYYKYSTIDMFYYSGIQVSDIYNTFVNDFYISIRKQKWLIYEFKDDKIYLVIEILNNLLKLSDIFNQYNWGELTLTKQGLFYNKWKKLLNSIKTNTGLSGYSFSLIKKTFITLFSRFYKNYIYTNKLIKDNQLKKIENDKEKLVGDDIEYNQEREKYIDEFIISINNLDAKYIYEFLITEIGYLINTPYNNILFEEENNKLKLRNPLIKSLENDISITPKNYYNFGKALSYEIPRNDELDTNKNRLAFLWDGLSIEQKDLVCLRLNTPTNGQRWFRITQILQKIYGYDNREANRINKGIYENIRKNIIDLTFKNLVKKGCLSEFKYKPNISDEKILTDDYNTKKNMLDRNMKLDSLSDKQINYYENECYYYINNKKYGKLDKITRPIKNSSRIESLSYFEHLREVKKRGDIWYTFYAMDWVCQLDFYIKFLNHRIMYITGATGQGKSTQIPKLTLYGLKAFYYKNSGKVVCTQPRIAPTVDNIKMISSSMGISIENYNEYYKDNIRTWNGIMQFKHSIDSHIDINEQYYLRMVTDGTLLVQMKESQTLKKLKKHEDENSNNSNISITNENIYDIVMVDEAHEHNVNMDIILSLSRNMLLYNNDVKLIIISATMDDDEPKYRSYYRYIDDNLEYPIKLNALQLGISKNYIDRRFHISPPGKTTQHIVNDHYENSSLDTYKNNEELGIEKVKDIFSRTTNGDILFFSTTVKKIISICNKLNPVIPNNCICLPFYAKMIKTKKYFDIVTNIDKEIERIDIDKIDLVSVFIGDKKEEYAQKTNKGSYKRVVIIATSVAEASITIPSLKFIIDLGYQLKPEYDYEKKISVPKEIKIIESSRIQRRGRVGRVASGDVYYMYPKGSREFEKPKYTISTENFSEQFTSLLAINEDKENQIIDTDILNKLITFQNLEEEEINNLNDYEQIIYDQYKIPLNIILNIEDKIKGADRYEIEKGFIKWLLPSYKTGISSKCLLDTCGQFHLIHPFETRFIRDPLTRNLYNKEGILEFIPLNETYLMVETSRLNLDLIQITKDKSKFYKTDLFFKTEFIKNKLNEYKPKLVKSIMISHLLDVFDELIFCNSCLESIDKKLENIIDVDNKGKFKEYSKFIKNNSQKNSDLELFLSLYENLSSLMDFNDIKSMLDINENKIKYLLENLKNYNMTYEKFVKLCIKYKITQTEFNRLIRLKLKGKLDQESAIEEKNLKPDKTILKKYIKSIPNLYQLIKYKNMNLSIIETIILKYIIDKIKYTPKLEEDNILKTLEEYNELLKIRMNNLGINEKITLCYLLPNLDRLLSYRNEKLYLAINSKVLYERSIRDFFGLQLTLLKNITPIVLQLKDDSMGDEVKYGMLVNIDKTTLLKYIPHIIIIYERFNDDFISKTNYIKNIDYIINKISLQKENNLNVFYNIMIEEIKKIQNQQGGFFVNSLIKMRISTLKKIKKLYDTLEDKLKKKIDNFDYTYVHINGLNIVGLHIIKKDVDNYIQIFSTVNNNNSLNYLKNILNSKGYTVVGIDMSGYISKIDQGIINLILE